MSDDDRIRRMSNAVDAVLGLAGEDEQNEVLRLVATARNVKASGTVPENVCTYGGSTTKLCSRYLSCPTTGICMGTLGVSQVARRV